MLENQPNADTIKTAIKLEVDYQIMEFGNHIYQLIYDPQPLVMPQHILEMMQLSGRKLISALEKRKPLGFQVLKSWESYITALKAVKNNASYSKYLSNQKLVALIKLIEELEIASRNFIAGRFYKPIDETDGSKDFLLAKGRNGAYRLIHNEDTDEGVFYDGDEPNLLRAHHPVADELPILA